MKKLIFSLFIICFSSYLMNGQILEWVTTFGGEWSCGAHGLAVDTQGNVYSCGYYTGDIDMDPGEASVLEDQVGGGDIFIQKTDADGNYLWSQVFGSTDPDEATEIVVDGLGNLYITGYFSGTIDFDPGPGDAFLSSQGSADVLIMKLDTDGNYLWAKSFGEEDFDCGSGIGVDFEGNVYTAGYFRGTVDFDPGSGTEIITSNGALDAYVNKLDSDGNFVWVKTFGGSGSEHCRGFRVDSQGNAYSTGYFDNTVDFDPGPAEYNLTSLGFRDVFVQKLDSSGDLVWARSFGAFDNDEGFAISVDLEGNVYSTGYFRGVVDFDPSSGTDYITSEGSRNAYVHKLDAEGNYIWCRAFLGEDTTEGYSIAIGNEGDVYTTGYFKESIDFDPGEGIETLTSEGDRDIFLHKMNAEGNLIWVAAFGETAWDTGYEVVIDHAESIYTTGNHTGTADFDPGPELEYIDSGQGANAFVQKLNSCPETTSLLTITACEFYVSPSEDYTWFESGVYNDVLPNSQGCDSLITIDLTVNSIDATVTNTSPVLTANWPNAVYQWMDCDNNFLVIPGATDQGFTATSNGNYAVQVSYNGCTLISDCQSVTNVGIHESGFETELRAYPNPTNGHLGIDLGQEYGQVQVVITDELGREIQRNLFSSSDKIMLELKGEPGVYFVEVKCADKRVMVRVVKE